MAKKTAPAPSPLTFDLPVSLLNKIETQRKKLGLASTSEVVRYALGEFDLSKFEAAPRSTGRSRCVWRRRIKPRW